MLPLKMDSDDLKKLCIQTVKSVITAGLPPDSQVTIKGLINVIVNNCNVIVVDFNEHPTGITNNNVVPQSPNNNLTVGNVRRSLANSMATPTRRGRPAGFSPSTRGRSPMGYSPRGRGLGTPRGYSPRTPRSVPSMRGAINITPQAHMIMPKSNVGVSPMANNNSNGAVIEIDDDDGPPDIKTELNHQPQYLNHDHVQHSHDMDIKPIMAAPFAGECHLHEMNQLTKQEPGVSGSISSKRPSADSTMSPPPFKAMRQESNSNFGSDVIFKTESQTKASSSPHGQTDAFKCPLCAKTFQFRSWFEKHLLGHENKGDLVSGACDGVVKQLISCRYCPKRFMYQKDLDLHMNSHIKESFRCVNCGQTYPSRKQLLEHMDREHKDNTPAPSGGQTLDIQALGLN